MRSLRVLLLFVLALLPACGILPTDGGPRTEQVTLYVASYTRTCMAMVEQQCIQVKEDPADAWGNFYAEIEGFSYEPGYEYVLRVAVTEIRNPPADGSSLRYRLVELVSKTRV